MNIPALFEKYNIRIGVSCQLHICKHHLIHNLLIVYKIINGFSISHCFICK